MPDIENGNPNRIKLTLKNDRYDVLVGEGVLDQIGRLGGRQFGRKAALVSDTNVFPLYGDLVCDALEKEGIEVVKITVPAGEASKCMEEVTRICREMLQAGLDRKSFLVALGGGVIGDLAGFAAAIFQRGIPCLQIPTTVVSQVDSSVGGKTGVNTPEGKNLLGAFHQPKIVLADVRTLASLPDREFNEGCAEIIKHGAIRDRELLNLMGNAEAAKNDLIRLVSTNVAIKAAVVEEDEKETTGVRALLNFGHTIGHGIEAAGGYGRFLHGEAISLGLVAATRLSVEKSGLPEEDATQIIDTLKAWDLPIVLEADLEKQSIIDAMARDKKFQDGEIRFVLLKDIGEAFVSDQVSIDDISNAIDRLRSE
ncbi:MAG: 3-dehydroquinate synthase [Verrucomicrobiales bacterium]|nr:3-dehydroquinate synthase [Verrucomicrobiales bacterium]